MPRALYANHKWLPRAFNAAVSVQSPILKTGRAGRLSGHGCIRTPSRGSRTPHLAVTVSLANSLFTTTQELDHRLGIIGFTLVTGRSSGSQAPRDTAVANRRPFRIIIATSRVFLSHSQPPRGAGTDQPLRASVRDRARFFRRLTRLRAVSAGLAVAMYVGPPGQPLSPIVESTYLQRPSALARRNLGNLSVASEGCRDRLSAQPGIAVSLCQAQASIGNWAGRSTVIRPNTRRGWESPAVAKHAKWQR